MGIDEWAAGQHGLVTHEQALQYGLSTKQVGGRVSAGHWIRVVRGVYRVAGAPVTWQQVAHAACLAGPQPTRASHVTSAALAGLAKAPVLPHVTVPASASCRTPIALVHRADLDESDVASLFGIPCTGTARTLVDCASLLGDAALASMVDDALCRKLTTIDAIEQAAARTRRGIRRLRRVLDAWAGDIAAGSPAEMRLQRQLLAWGYPKPVRQHPVRDDTGRIVGVLDLAWPDRLIGLEYDSDQWHNPRHWKHDETRHAAVLRLGWALLHADKQDLRAGERRFRNELEWVWRTRRAPTAL
ncbi:MAG TPA: type IV toxin-antitoxin system AbiEi family antitoxin domain-containing protein [Acidimicrobiales bacterium]|jgi:hypothetical protein|nr:type IV toxin-antitoxin system AbiEi family antitoxin domain-containing protein [Acidimicrobiales bacterium]